MRAILRGAGLVSPAVGQRGERRQDRQQEPREPHALTAAARPDQVHAVVPVARADERQPMLARVETHRDRADAMLVQRGPFDRDRRPFVRFVFAGLERTAVEERHLLVEHRCIAGRLHVLQRRVDEPQPIVRKARAHALPARLVPPVLDVSFAELPRRGVEQVVPRESRRREQQREHVLQLVAETEGAARLVKGRPPPHSARQALVRQPAVQHQVERTVRRRDDERAEQAIPESERLRLRVVHGPRLAVLA